MPGRYLQEDVNEVRERADLVEVISGYTQLRKAGAIFKGLCPFHQEKSPSFTVDPAKRLYHCFGCHAGGDVFTFLRDIEGLPFPEAAERLAGRVGITLRAEPGTGAGQRAPEGGRRRLMEATKAAQEYFAGLLLQSPEAAAARRYVEGRGFTSEDAKAWGLGYAPAGRDTLYRHLLAAKFSPQQIVDAGLALVTEQGEHRDRFRGRLTFPIADLAGDVVGFGARALGDEPPKYLNSPETSLYHKSKLLYGLDRAKREIVREGQAVVCEGYTDVMGLHHAGVRTAVATCGTALGEDHFATLKRFCDRVVLAFDADAAGSFASERGFGIDEKVGLQVLVALLPAGKDPADLALQDGAEAVAATLGAAVPLLAFMLETELARQRTDTPEAKARALKALAAMIAREPNRIVRGEYAFWMARALAVDARQVQQEISELARPPGRDAGGPRVSPRRSGQLRLEREALALLLDSPGTLHRVREWLTEEHFTTPEHRVVLQALLATSGTGASALDALPDDASRRLAAELALTTVTTEAVDEVFLRLAETLLERQIAALQATLGRLDPNADPDNYDATYRELLRLEEQRRRFDDR
ncbi:MAG TPA: DNA primase [Actinomycetota bacterium]|nr:DNA primase [Actinomycetota bacterium]